MGNEEMGNEEMGRRCIAFHSAVLLLESSEQVNVPGPAQGRTYFDLKILNVSHVLHVG